MVRKATIEDVVRIAEIHVTGWRFAYRHLIPDEYLFKTMNVPARIDAFTKAMNERNEDTYVFEEDQIIKAFMIIGPCRDGDRPSSFELWGLYVDPFMLRNGIGSKMLNFCEKRALDLGYRDVVLWVLEDNMIGRSFYDKMGYTFDGTRKYLDRFGLYEIRYQKNIK
ncbi:MAG TPA: GNAT family N-acetyltransferase [Thermoclostridium sp.]|jgi:ribosomal protein S18 acetylase RimI-like enzyme|nr:GNAT family N-acetyltransferase [Clostridiaceae bacterium]HOQ76805.1 GNAT family N-acetyltransferase [Thermoclostridium sp.]